MSLMDPILKTRGSSPRTRTRREIDDKSHITNESHVSDARATRSEAAVDPPDVALSRSILKRPAVFLPILDLVKSLASEAIEESEAPDDEAGDQVSAEDHLLHKLIGEDETDEVSEGDEEDEELKPRYMLRGYTMGFQEFELLCEKLPDHLGNFLLKYDLYDGHLCVRVCPSRPHARINSLVEYIFTEWQRDPNNPSPIDATLIGTLDENYYYTNQRSKSPDVSFVPQQISIPPAIAQPNSVTARHPQGVPFPTVVFECGYKNESWPQLIRDASLKTFSRTTSVQCWIGCKLYRASRTFRCVWGKRHVVGHNMKLVKTTHKMSLDAPTTVQLKIPVALIYWGSLIPQHLQGTDCIIECDHIRRRAKDYVE